MTVPATRSESWDVALHDAASSDQLFIFSQKIESKEILKLRGQSSIGVVCHKYCKFLGTYYVPIILNRRYNTLLQN